MQCIIKDIGNSLALKFAAFVCVLDLRMKPVCSSFIDDFKIKKEISARNAERARLNREAIVAHVANLVLAFAALPFHEGGSQNDAAVVSPGVGDEQVAARDLTSQDSDGTDLSCCTGEDGRVNVVYYQQKGSIEKPERSLQGSYISGVEAAQGSAWVAEQEPAR